MMPLDESSTALGEDAEDPPNLVEVGIYRNSRDAFQHGLVVLALGWPFWLRSADDVSRLLVEPRAATMAREQLACFDRESIGWPPAPVARESPPQKADLWTPLLWLLTVSATFWAQGEWNGLTNAGLLDAQAVFDRGEVWRPFTALFLHADFGHLLSNALGGLFVFSAVVTTIGRCRGWLLIALAAIAGNLAAAALIYPEPYRSLGASTAIFAGLGLLTGRAIRVVAKSDHPHRWRSTFVPFAAGITVLGLFGAGGVQVDGLAHVTGFIAGLAMSFASPIPIGSSSPAR